MIIKYKNYIGKAEYDSDAKIYHGEVIGIRNVITFVSPDKKGLKDALRDSVGDYFELCKENGKRPEKSYSGKLLLRINPTTHANIAIQASYI